MREGMRGDRTLSRRAAAADTHRAAADVEHDLALEQKAILKRPASQRAAVCAGRGRRLGAPLAACERACRIALWYALVRTSSFSISSWMPGK